MSTAEIWSALGLPARAAARVLLAPRYFVNGFSHIRTWNDNAYALARYGPSYRWRVWLLFDAEDLEELEHLINQGSDKEVLEMREAKLEQFRLVALVVCLIYYLHNPFARWLSTQRGMTEEKKKKAYRNWATQLRSIFQGALLATLALQALSLPLLTETTFVVRACFIQSTTLSLLATFFTCIQQRELGVIRTASALRIWLSNGVQYRNAHESLVWQSSLASLTLMEAPYELITLAVSNFVVGMAVYMADVWMYRLPTQKETGALEGIAVLVYFAVGTGFAFTLFPVLLGSKDCEWKVGTMEAAEVHIETQSQERRWLESQREREIQVVTKRA